VSGEFAELVDNIEVGVFREFKESLRRVASSIVWPHLGVVSVTTSVGLGTKARAALMDSSDDIVAINMSQNCVAEREVRGKFLKADAMPWEGWGRGIKRDMNGRDTEIANRAAMVVFISSKFIYWAFVNASGAVVCTLFAAEHQVRR